MRAFFRTSLLLLALAACEPNLGNPSSLVTGTRVLAVRGTPPEALPGAMVQYDSLVVSPEGTVASASALWSYCLASLPPDDNNVVSPLCLNDSSQSPMQGPAAAAAIALPADACQYFGPDVPSAPPGQPPQAPAVPDSTGGYYQPLRAKFAAAGVDGNPAFGLERIQCGLSDATADTSVEFNKTYSANNNPSLASVTAQSTTSTLTLYAGNGPRLPFSIPAKSDVTFIASWLASSAETFPVYDVANFALGQQRESIEVSWFATGGSFASDRTGRAATDLATTTTDVWTAPAEAGAVHFWVVMRDDRGGVDFGSFDVTVEE